MGIKGPPPSVSDQISFVGINSHPPPCQCSVLGGMEASFLLLLLSFTGMSTNIPSVSASFYVLNGTLDPSSTEMGINYPAKVLVNLVPFSRISFHPVPLPCFFQYFKAKT